MRYLCRTVERQVADGEIVIASKLQARATMLYPTFEPAPCRDDRGLIWCLKIRDVGGCKLWRKPCNNFQLLSLINVT